MTVTNNVRQIEGTVKKLLAYRDLNGMTLDLPNVTRVVSDMYKVEGSSLPTPNLIINQVCKFYNVEESVLRGTQKTKGVAEARQVAMYLIRKMTNLSLPQIGQVFGNRDHTTVLHGCDKIAAGVKDAASGMANVINDIKNLIAEGK